MRRTEQRGGLPRRRRRKRRTRRRPGPASGGGLDTPWKSFVAGRRGRGSRGSRRRKRPTTTTMMKMMTSARLGLSPGLGLGQEPSSQPPSGLMSSVPGVGTPGSQPEGRGQSERVLDPSAGGVEATPGSQAEASAPREPPPTPAAQGSDPQVVVAVPGQSAPRASRAPKARVVPKLPAKRTSAAAPGVEIRETSPQARLIMARSG
jgi:hypothetical protein